MENRIWSERGENKRTSAPTREKRWGTLVKKGILSALVLALTLSAFAACDGPDETETGAGTGSPDATIGDVTGTVDGGIGADFDFGPMLDQIDFADLLTSTEGQEKIDSVYNIFLDDVANNPEMPVFNGESVNFIRSLTSAVGEKRHNVMLEIKNVDNNRWSYVLVSTKDDFAVVARDSKKHNEYIVGFMDGEVVDQAGYLTSTDRTMINDMIMAEGYDATVNQVRDEFFGQLFVIRSTPDENYILGFTGHTDNVRHEDGYYNPVEERDYIIEQIQVMSSHSDEIYTTMDATYDIPDNYLGTKLGS